MTDVAAFWDNIAEKYAAQPLPDPGSTERKVAITLALMRPEHVVLDVGCGTGTLALRWATTAAAVHGLDVSSEMIRIARGKAASQHARNLTFHVGAFDETFDAFAPGTVDVVCAYNVLHLVSGDVSAALARIHALLRPGGAFVSSTPCLGDSWVPYRPALAVMRALGKAPPVTILAKRTLVSAIRDVGFVDVASPDVGADAMVAFVVARKPA
jgi:arsenite methyltransferase